MTVNGVLARPLLAGIFIYGGVDALRHPEGKASLAEGVAPKIAEPLGLPTDTITLVRINGAVQVGAGALLALGKCRRLAAVALATSLVPTTLAGHRFWDEADEKKRPQQTIQFLKNAAVLGGLVTTATDTGGRPSLAWRARRAARRAAGATAGASAAAVELTQRAAGIAEDASKGAGSVSRRAAKRASKASNRAAKSATGASKGAAELTKRAAKVTKNAAREAAAVTRDTAGRTKETASGLAHDLRQAVPIGA